MKIWITKKRPEKAGIYVVTLECPQGTWDNDTQKFTPDPEGRMRRWIDTRYFANPNPEDSWAMVGENPAEMHWTEECGSYCHEKVVAWMDVDEITIYKGELIEGKEYDFGED